jgi:hypothetical protein
LDRCSSELGGRKVVTPNGEAYAITSGRQCLVGTSLFPIT